MLASIYWKLVESILSNCRTLFRIVGNSKFMCSLESLVMFVSRYWTLFQSNLRKCRAVFRIVGNPKFMC